MGRGLSRLGVESKRLPKTKVTKKFLIRILSYFIPYRKKLIPVFIVISLSSILGLIPPILLKNIIDKALYLGITEQSPYFQFLGYKQNSPLEKRRFPKKVQKIPEALPQVHDDEL